MVVSSVSVYSPPNVSVEAFTLPEIPSAAYASCAPKAPPVNAPSEGVRLTIIAKVRKTVKICFPKLSIFPLCDILVPPRVFFFVQAIYCDSKLSIIPFNYFFVFTVLTVDHGEYNVTVFPSTFTSLYVRIRT